MKTTIQILYDTGFSGNFYIAYEILKNFLFTERRRPYLDLLNDVVQCFFHLYGLKNKATSKTKIQKILSSFGLSVVKVYLRDESFTSDVGSVYLRPSKGTHWVLYINQKKFDPFGCSPPQRLSEFIIKRNTFFLYSEYKIQSLDYCFAAYCSGIIYLTKVVGIEFKPAVLNLYYPTIS